jgi:hypothetical protein
MWITYVYTCESNCGLKLSTIFDLEAVRYTTSLSTVKVELFYIVK